MIEPPEIDEIEKTVSKIYDNIVTKKHEKFLAWQWINLVFICLISISLFIAIFSYIQCFDSHFKTNQNLFLSLAIVFSGLFVGLLIGLIIIRHGQNCLKEKIKDNFDHRMIINIYDQVYQEQDNNLKLNDLSYQWTITPLNLHPNDNFLINDLILDGVYQQCHFNIGSISEATNTVVDNLEPSLAPQPYSINYYRYLYLTIKSEQFWNQTLEITRKIKPQKNNLTFDNFFIYDHQNPHITEEFKEKVIANMIKTKLIPNLKIENNILSINLATISTNGWNDNYDSFINLEFSLNKRMMIEQIITAIQKDYVTLQKALVWFNLINEKTGG
ncbi:hypothetical protein P344_03785 [Spiroplasma mirum ATCC 29335]|uniref:DUF3137 domain-containing protein n=1 Tax=Spiroplasma mirum ATCC 29335 TaxID=838561 RepID=W0GLK6_9MOLU|nr:MULTISPECIES: hypothetical protein [Spiroplasma]AHF61062.1 hypothetical protein SMM_0640 [Spiroplasma mirum ATCC 29335]AHI58096.1 hypothetical protein P344_03785 [Spiroplasma mirum ATCC 29335]AKM53159.1 hypothetical protein SATRI_v1c07010 [Spiroplasma atrichopogonis]